MTLGTRGETVFAGQGAVHLGILNSYLEDPQRLKRGTIMRGDAIFCDCVGDRAASTVD
jgi:hypothetical protein